MENHTILITGATGFIGRWLTLELLSAGHRVTALMRNPQSQKQDLQHWLKQHGQTSENLYAVKGDLQKSNLGLSDRDLSRLGNLDYIFHLGAAMQWKMTTEQARAVNVKPIDSLIRLARRSRQFKRFIQVSGFMVRSKKRLTELGICESKPISEAHWLSLYKRLGSYEASKFEAHFKLLEQLQTQKIPYTIINPGAVIGHSETGEIDQYDSIVAMIHELYKGSLPAIPGTCEDWLPVIPVDFIAKFMSGMIRLPHSRNQQYTLIDERTPDLASMLAMLSRYFHIPQVKKRVPIALLKAASRSGLGSLLPLPTEPLGFISDEAFDNTNTLLLADELGISLPAFDCYFEQFANYLIASRFLRQQPLHTSKMLNIEGGKVFVSGNTQTPKFLLLHGLPLNSDSWAAIENQYPGETLRVDLPGMGRSSLTPADTVNWLHRIFGSIDSRPILIGHSLGSGLAVELAERHPELISGLVLISPYFLNKTPAAWKTNPFLSRTMMRLTGKRRLLHVIEGDDEAANQARSQLLWDAEPRSYIDNLSRMYSEAWRKAPILVESLNKLNTPYILVTGTRDLPDTTLPLRTIEGAGHNPQLTHPDDIVQQLESLEVKQWLGDSAIRIARAS